MVRLQPSPLGALDDLIWTGCSALHWVCGEGGGGVAYIADCTQAPGSQLQHVVEIIHFVCDSVEIAKQ